MRFVMNHEFICGDKIAERKNTATETHYKTDY